MAASALTIGSWAAADGQTTASLTFNQLEIALSAALAKTAPDNPEASRLVHTIRDRVGELEDQINTAQFSQSYLQTVALDTVLLNRAIASFGTASSLADLRNVAADLTAKTDTLKSSLGLAQSQGGDLTVRVTTVRNGAVVGGFLVRVNMAGDPDADPPYRAFATPTSPAQGQLAPGTYVILIKTTDQDLPTRRQFVTVAGLPTIPFEVRVPVP